MPEANIVDHSSKHPRQAAPLAGASNLVLIDNYDSFTWNVYQYLVEAGATVTVYRNDKVTLEDLIAKNPTQLVVSPGPGHPDKDAGISIDAIKQFSGKIPVLGVCMGEQCIFAAFGGKVDVTGEILHGKTSPLRHDSKGVYAGIPQNLPVTRYHSLAGTHATLPACLEVSSWIAGGPDGGKGIIMGVRHKELLVEGVQFHPESILTEQGRKMLKNFLQMNGGTWAENTSANGAGMNDNATLASQDSISKPKESILEEIYRVRKDAVAAQKLIPSQRPKDLQELYDLDLSPPLIPFKDRVRASPYSLSLLAEIKRASPSKGPIAMDVCAPAQAREYALAGASVISVLTEPEWFKGTIDDLKAVRRAIEGMPNRPAVLRKEFVFDEYQILEARLAGADTVLLIVKMLERPLLERLYKYSRSIGMEPLVEVNTTEEMEVAIELGSQVIGVNNRNLTNFEVDLETTSRLMANVPKETIVLALSGISGPKDVEAYRRHGVGGVLVGEALMKAANVTKFVAELLGENDSKALHPRKQHTLVKICGTRTPEAAKAAIEAGADFIGVILVKGRKRTVSATTAGKISEVVHGMKHGKDRGPAVTSDSTERVVEPSKATDFFDHHTKVFRSQRRALLVGVFQNQPLEEILDLQKTLELDIVQLHGDEPLEWASMIPVPVIRRFSPEDAGLAIRGYHALPLIDTAAGGTGKMVDKSKVESLFKRDPSLKAILAGGLTPHNVGSILEELQTSSGGIVTVDVSSGVEEDGKQSHALIKEFIEQVKKN